MCCDLLGASACCGIWIYVVLMLPLLGTDGPNSDVGSFAMNLAIVPFFMFHCC